MIRSLHLPLIVLAVAATWPALAADDPVVARRGADQITLSQVHSMLAALDAESRQKLAAPGALPSLLRNVLLQRGILQEAQAQKWDQRPEIIAAGQRARDLAVTQSFLATQATIPPGYPPQAEIEAAYSQNRQRFMQPRGYHLAQAFIPATGPAAEPARRRLADLRAQAARPHASLEDAAKKANVQYVDLGWLPETQIVPDIKATVAGMLEGTIAQPVCTASGCHLIRLVATRPAGPAPLADVRDSLVRALRQQKEQQAERAYADTLLARQPVQINEIQLSHALEP